MKRYSSELGYMAELVGISHDEMRILLEKMMYTSKVNSQPVIGHTLFDYQMLSLAKVTMERLRQRGINTAPSPGNLEKLGNELLHYGIIAGEVNDATFSPYTAALGIQEVLCQAKRASKKFQVKNVLLQGAITQASIREMREVLVLCGCYPDVNITVVDLSPYFITNTRQDDIHLVQADLQRLPFKSGSLFDFVFGDNLFGYHANHTKLPNSKIQSTQKLIASETARVLRPGGIWASAEYTYPMTYKSDPEEFLREDPIRFDVARYPDDVRNLLGAKTPIDSKNLKAKAGTMHWAVKCDV